MELVHWDDTKQPRNLWSMRETERTLGFASIAFLGLMIIITGSFSIYVFVFIFRGILSEI